MPTGYAATDRLTTVTAARPRASCMAQTIEEGAVNILAREYGAWLHGREWAHFVTLTTAQTISRVCPTSS